MATPGIAMLLMLCGAALWVRLSLASSDVLLLVQKSLPDDAFYYFTLARNVTSGLGLTLDGENLTNGFHPLWMILLAPLFLFSGGDGAPPIHAALYLGAILNIFTGLLLYFTTKRLTGSESASLVATTAYLFNPGAILGSINGLETSLALLLFAAISFLCLALLTNGGAGAKTPAILGVAAGLTFLARTDYVFMLVAVAGYLALTQPNRTKTSISYLAAVAVVVSPWLTWNLLNFKTPFQVSGQALPFVLHQEFLSGGATSWGVVLHALSQVERAVLTVIPNLFFIYPVQHDELRIGAIVHLLSLSLALFALWLRPGLRRKVLQQLSPAAHLVIIPTLAVAAIVLAHSGVRWSLQGWYFAPVLYIAALYLGLAYRLGDASLATVGVGWLRTPAVALVLLALVLFGQIRLSEVWRAGYYPWQIGMYQEAQWLRKNALRQAQDIPSEEWRIGVYNSGIVSYFSPVKIINLDGVANNAAYRALSTKGLAQYIKDQRITHLADYGYTLEQYMPFMGPQPVLRLTPVHIIDDPAVVWQDSFITINRVEMRPY